MTTNESGKRPLFISIEGVLGIGKSWLCSKLAEDLGYKLYPEPLDGDIATVRKEFYANPAKRAFDFQVLLFHHRYRQHKRLVLDCDSGTGAIQDRSIYGDKPFAYLLNDLGHLDDTQLLIYENIWTTMRHGLVEPDMMIFLFADTSTIMDRIKGQRGRPEEMGITEAYIEALAEYNETLYNEKRNDGVVCLNYNWNDPGTMYPTLLRHIMAEERRKASQWRSIR